MHTVEQAKKLWCPMARVAQIGDFVQIQSAYNRSLEKTVEKVNGVDENGKAHTFAALAEPRVAISGAAMCIGNKCAMWRWREMNDDGTEPYRKVKIHVTEYETDANPARPIGVPDSYEFLPYKPQTDLLTKDARSAIWLEPESEALARSVGYRGLVRS